MLVRPSGRASAACIAPARALSRKLQMVHGPETLKRLAGATAVGRKGEGQQGRRRSSSGVLHRSLPRAHGTPAQRAEHICLCLLHSAQEAACTCSCKCVCAARTGSCMRRSTSSAD
eukprot:2857974-Pleurochrysis_carterae.AAC.1